MLLFAYGSNLAASEMADWGPEARFAAVGRLPGFALARTRRSVRWQGGVVDLVERPRSEVWGALYELPGEALERLDVKEGAGFAYRRREVRVEWAGGAGEAVAYEVIAKDPSTCPPATRSTPRWCSAGRASADCPRTGCARSDRS